MVVMTDYHIIGGVITEIISPQKIRGEFGIPRPFRGPKARGMVEGFLECSENFLRADNFRYYPDNYVIICLFRFSGLITVIITSVIWQ